MENNYANQIQFTKNRPKFQPTNTILGTTPNWNPLGEAQPILDFVHKSGNYSPQLNSGCSTPNNLDLQPPRFAKLNPKTKYTDVVTGHVKDFKSNSHQNMNQANRASQLMNTGTISLQNKQDIVPRFIRHAPRNTYVDTINGTTHVFDNPRSPIQPFDVSETSKQPKVAIREFANPPERPEQILRKVKYANIQHVESLHHHPNRKKQGVVPYVSEYGINSRKSHSPPPPNVGFERNQDKIGFQRVSMDGLPSDTRIYKGNPVAHELRINKSIFQIYMKLRGIYKMQNGKRLAASALIYQPNSREIVLIRRNNPPRQHMFAPPGGKVEPGETIKEAAIREIKEEISVDLILPEPYNVLTVNETDQFIVTAFIGCIEEGQTPDRWEFVRFDESGLYLGSKQIQESECIPNLHRLVLFGEHFWKMLMEFSTINRHNFK